MILVKEITDDWVDVKRPPNHTYLMDDKMEKTLGYFRWHNPNDFQMFKNPVRLDRRYRKFKILQTGYMFANAKPAGKQWVLNGSKGNKYVVLQSELGYNCSCIGYKYHGKCKHIEQVTNESE